MKTLQDLHAHVMIFSSDASMLLCTRSHFCACPKSLPAGHCPHHVIKSFLPGYLRADWDRQGNPRATPELWLAFPIMRAKFFGCCRRHRFQILTVLLPSARCRSTWMQMWIFRLQSATMLTAPTVIIRSQRRFTEHESHPSLVYSWERIAYRFQIFVNEQHQFAWSLLLLL